MTNDIYVGGKTYVATRAEGSNADITLYGTYATGGSDDKGVMITNLNPTLKNNLIKVFTLGGGRNYKTVVPGKLEISGSFEFEVQSGAFFKYIIGTSGAATTCTKDLDAVAITGSPTAALKCYAIPEDDLTDSFSLYEYIISDSSANDILNKYLGCKMNQISLKSDTENPLHATCDFIAQTTSSTLGTQAAPSTTYLADIPYMFYKANLAMGASDYGTGTGTASTLTDTSKAWTTDQWITNYVVIDAVGTAFAISANSATALTVSGTPATGEYSLMPKSSFTTSAIVSCNSADATWMQNLEPYWTLDNSTGRGPKYAIEKNREYTLKLDLNFVNAEQLGRFYNGATSGTSPTTNTMSTFCVTVDYTNATSLGDSFKQLRFVYHDVYFDDTSLPVNPKDMRKQEVTAFAKKCFVYFISNEAQ